MRATRLLTSDDPAKIKRDKDAEGLIKPPPGVVYDRPGYGIAFVDDRGRYFTFADIGGRLDAWCGQCVRLTPASARDLAVALIRFAEPRRAGRTVPGALATLNPTGTEPGA